VFLKLFHFIAHFFRNFKKNYVLYVLLRLLYVLLTKGLLYLLLNNCSILKTCSPMFLSVFLILLLSVIAIFLGDEI